MNMLRFEWDENKNTTNKTKHGISFEEATSVFYNDDSIVFDDPDHSSLDEERFLIIGYSNKANCLTVAHCLRENETVIRIISARRSTKSEREEFVKLKGEHL